MDIFSINKNLACLIYVLYITLQKLIILSLFPIGVMHHEPCFHAGSSTSGFLLGRIRKVSSLFFFFLFFFFFLISPYGLPGFWSLLWVGVYGWDLVKG